MGLRSIKIDKKLDTVQCILNKIKKNLNRHEVSSELEKLESVEKVYGRLLEYTEANEEDEVEREEFMARIKELMTKYENKGGENMDNDIKELYLEILNGQKVIENRLDSMNYIFNKNSKNIEKISQKLKQLDGNILSHGDYCEERFEQVYKKYLQLKKEIALFNIRQESKESQEKGVVKEADENK